MPGGRGETSTALGRERKWASSWGNCRCPQWECGFERDCRWYACASCSVPGLALARAMGQGAWRLGLSLAAPAVSDFCVTFSFQPPRARAPARAGSGSEPELGEEPPVLPALELILKQRLGGLRGRGVGHQVFNWVAHGYAWHAGMRVRCDELGAGPGPLCTRPPPPLSAVIV